MRDAARNKERWGKGAVLLPRILVLTCTVRISLATVCSLFLAPAWFSRSRAAASASAAASFAVASACGAAGKNASWSVRRALLTPQVNSGSRYRRGRST